MSTSITTENGSEANAANSRVGRALVILVSLHSHTHSGSLQSSSYTHQRETVLSGSETNFPSPSFQLSFTPSRGLCVVIDLIVKDPCQPWLSHFLLQISRNPFCSVQIASAAAFAPSITDNMQSIAQADLLPIAATWESLSDADKYLVAAKEASPVSNLRRVVMLTISTEWRSFCSAACRIRIARGTVI